MILKVLEVSGNTKTTESVFKVIEVETSKEVHRGSRGHCISFIEGVNYAVKKEIEKLKSTLGVKEDFVFGDKKS